MIAGRVQSIFMVIDFFPQIKKKEINRIKSNYLLEMVYKSIIFSLQEQIL